MLCKVIWNAWLPLVSSAEKMRPRYEIKRENIQNIPDPGGHLWNFGIFSLIRGNFVLEISKVICLFGFA
jgi:hypothetical protein